MATATQNVIRAAREEDVPSINAIMNYYILNTVMTFTTEIETDAGFQAKFQQLSRGGFPFLVATALPTDESDTSRDVPVLGVAYTSPWRPQKAAYDHTGEVTLYVHPEHQGKGIGTLLLNATLQAVRRTKLKELIAVMAVDDGGKDAGLALRDYYVRFGFREVGRLQRVGLKFDRW